MNTGGWLRGLATEEGSGSEGNRENFLFPFFLFPFPFFFFFFFFSLSLHGNRCLFDSIESNRRIACGGGGFFWLVVFRCRVWVCILSFWVLFLRLVLFLVFERNTGRYLIESYIRMERLVFGRESVLCCCYVRSDRSCWFRETGTITLKSHGDSGEHRGSTVILRRTSKLCFKTFHQRLIFRSYQHNTNVCSEHFHHKTQPLSPRHKHSP